MADSKSKKPTVGYQFDPHRDEHQIGVTIDGQFVAFASLSSAVVGQRVERAENYYGEGENEPEDGE